MIKLAIWPAAFVFLWSTGFIGARYGLPHAEPMTLLALRFGIAALLLGAVAVASPFGARMRPARKDYGWIALVGLLMHGVYLGAVFVAMSWGLEAGAAAVIAGLSPIFTALAARAFLNEPLGPSRVLGMALGLGGVALVVWEKLAAGVGSPAAAALCLLAPIAFSAGAILQKARLSNAPMVPSAMIQYAAAAALMALFALPFESNAVEWTGEFVFALGWLVFALSFGAIFLLYYLLRRGAASSVSSLVFLVPSSTALIAWRLFGETLGPTALIGFALSAIGVALVNGLGAKRKAASATRPAALSTPPRR